MTVDLVLTEQRGPVLRVALNRPAKKNALTLSMYDLLTAALERAGNDEATRVVVITGAPGVFTAGNDLGDFARTPPVDEHSPVLRFLHALLKFKKPLIAAVDGAAVGIGVTMLMHCDLVVATDRVRFLMPFTKLGLVPEAAASLLIPALVGRQRASSWLLLSRPFDSAEALQAGLVNQVVPPDELDATADKLAQELAALPREAVLLTKGLIKRGLEAAVDETLRHEGALFVDRLRSPETAAALMAFMARKA